jgi:hypothetical protein
MDNFPGMFYQRHLDFYDYARTLYFLRNEYNSIPNVPEYYTYKIQTYNKANNYFNWLKQEMGLI